MKLFFFDITMILYTYLPRYLTLQLKVCVFLIQAPLVSLWKEEYKLMSIAHRALV